MENELPLESDAIAGEPGYSALVASTLKLVEGLVASKVSPDVASGHAVQLMTAFINATKKPTP